jgi:hypothetical protein
MGGKTCAVIGPFVCQRVSVIRELEGTQSHQALKGPKGLFVTHHLLWHGLDVEYLDMFIVLLMHSTIHAVGHPLSSRDNNGFCGPNLQY